jgi:hypothetical protein
MVAAWARLGDVEIGPRPGPGPPPEVAKRSNEAAAIVGLGVCTGVPVFIIGFLLIGTAPTRRGGAGAPMPVWALVMLWTLLTVLFLIGFVILLWCVGGHG